MSSQSQRLLSNQYSRLYLDIEHSQTKRKSRVLVFGVDNNRDILVRHTDLWNTPAPECMLSRPVSLYEGLFKITGLVVKAPGSQESSCFIPYDGKRQKVVMLARRYGRRLQEEADASNESKCIRKELEEDSFIGFARGFKYYTPGVADIITSMPGDKSAVVIYTNSELDKRLKAVYNSKVEKKTQVPDKITLYLSGSYASKLAVKSGRVDPYGPGVIAAIDPNNPPYAVIPKHRYIKYAVQVYKRDVKDSDTNGMVTIKRGANILGWSEVTKS